MTLSDLASIGTFVSAGAVVISLAYLGSQIRQARIHQQAAIRSGRANRMVTANTAAQEPSIAVAISKGLRASGDISDTQYAQFAHFCRASFYNAEDTYFQHKLGLLSDEAFASFIASVQGWAARAPGMRAGWKQFRGLFVAEFAEWMDHTLAQARTAPPVDGFAQWRALVDAEAAGSPVGGQS
jgi:hypothetical protein